MSKRARRRRLVLAALVTCSALALAATRLQLASAHLDKIPVRWDSGERDAVAGRFDAVLLAHLERLAPLRAGLRASRQGPSGPQAIAELHVDRCEVSQGEFHRFALWSEKNPQRLSRAPGRPTDWRYQSDTRKHRISGRLSAPVSGITYHDAWTYCASAGGRLPYAEEWMAIAGGAERRLYPWGNTFTDAAWPYLKPRFNASQRCAAHPATDTPEKVHDLGGNVAEWSQGPRQQAPPARRPLLHGGDGRRKPYAVAALNALYQAPSPQRRSPYAGFRCVYAARRRATPWGVALKLATLPSGVYDIGVPERSRLIAAAALSSSQLQDLHAIIQAQDARGPDGGAFRTSRCEITRRHYRLFLLDPLTHLGLYADDAEPDGQRYTPLDWQRQLQRPALPVSGVDWWSARAFARWAGGRLPNVAEWNAMLLGARYPWGHQDQSGGAVTGDVERATPRACGAVTADRTEQGVLDLAGNVSEWTASVVPGQGGYAPVIKGGSYLLPMDPASRAETQRAAPPAYRSPGLGLRLVFD